MDLDKFRKQFIKEELEINEKFGRIFSFIDFSNVNRWFDKDTQDWDNRLLPETKRLTIDIKKLKDFSDIFSDKARCYYGRDPKNKKSVGFSYVMRKIFGKRNFVDKDLQKIKHYLEPNEEVNEKRIKIDEDGNYVEIRKCNFDVEISVDAIKMLEYYDTFCLFSGDADFVYLNNFLRKKRKKVILIKAGYITTKLRNSADLIVNAQKIKKYIAKIEQRPDKSGLCG